MKKLKKLIIVSLLLLMTGGGFKNSFSSLIELVKGYAAYSSGSSNTSEQISGFSEEEKKMTEGYEFYSELDALGRCGMTFACVGPETMPTEERGEIGRVKPSGWHTVKYPDLISDLYLYNRCHLIGFQLCGENDNERNLITGTRHMNLSMLPYENEIADYVKDTGNHVVYRVTPIFTGNNLVADGVKMEAYSVEDNGAGVCFDVFIENKQPGIVIDYATGKSKVQ